MKNVSPSLRLAAGMAVILATTMLAACSGQDKTTTQDTSTYTAPPPPPPPAPVPTTRYRM
jgi:ABC-type glycerol-3-phosphate transport system substrate-binding protein